MNKAQRWHTVNLHEQAGKTTSDLQWPIHQQQAGQHSAAKNNNQTVYSFNSTNILRTQN